MDIIWSTAKKSLEENLVKTSAGSLFVAGAHQFKTAWVRDFCFAVPGLLALGYEKEVREQLTLFLKHKKADGLIARGFDVINPKLRVVSAVFGLSQLKIFSYGSRPVKPEFLGEHGTPAADSNLLVLLACLQWTDHTGKDFFFKDRGDDLQRVFSYAVSLKKDGFLEQPAFSDWQDSARREGATFYLNLLFCRVLEKLQAKEVPWSLDQDLVSFKTKLWNAFFDPAKGLFRGQLNYVQYSFETQLWCIEENIFSNFISQEELWTHLKNSNLWDPMAGRPSLFDYPASEVSWTTKVVGIGHYHDQFYWSWLMGESLKVACLMKDAAEVEKIKNILSFLCQKYQTIHEVYELKNELVPVARALYKSERPFTWGAAKIIEGLAMEQRLSSSHDA